MERETGGERQDGRVRTKILKTIGQQNEARNERQMVGPNEGEPTIRLISTGKYDRFVVGKRSHQG